MLWTVVIYLQLATGSTSYQYVNFLANLLDQVKFVLTDDFLDFWCLIF